MRIALSIEKFDPALGGGERYAFNFASQLRDAGHDVHVYTLPASLPDAGFTYHWVHIPPRFPRWHFARNARHLLLNSDYDLIHGFGKSVFMDVFRPGGGVHRAWQDHEMRLLPDRRARLRKRVQQLGSINQQLVLLLERQQFGPGGRHLIIAISEMVKAEIQRYYGCEAERIRVVHCGADLDRFNADARRRHRQAARATLALDDDELLVLFLGNNFERKGLAPLARAMTPLAARLSRPFRVLAVGDGNAEPARRIAAAAGLADRLLHVAQTDDPVPYYAAADIFCLPSYYDPCANAVVEALAMGLPVVTSTTTGCGEILTPGLEGYQVDADDAEGLAARLAEFADDGLRARASLAALALAAQRPLARDFKLIMDVYEEALALRRRP